MRRVAPSALVHEEIDRLFEGGADRGANIVSELASFGLQYLTQQALEQEQQDHLGRGRYERRGQDESRGWRNGYEDARIRTAEGAVEVRVPQVRGTSEPYRSKLMEFLSGDSEALQTLVTEMYARGLSTRDVEDCFRDQDGELLISRTAVSEITDRLWEDYQAFLARDLSEIDVEYLFCDAVYESLRRHGAKEAVLAAWCITTSGRKVLLHLAVGNKESETCWTEFLRNMVARGLRAPTSITSDGAPGLINAITGVLDRSIRIRCWYHRMANIRAKLPAEAVDEFLAHARAVRDAPTLEAGQVMAASLIDRYGAAYPSAVACFTEDLDASLAHLRLPARHRINARTTNLIERSFAEERRRTKVIPRFPDERSAMKLVFAVLIRAADRWCRVSVSELERQQLGLLRRELGVDPPPADVKKEVARGKKTAA